MLPYWVVVLEPSSWEKGTKTLGRKLSSMPMPVSRTVKRTAGRFLNRSSASAFMLTAPP